MCLAEESALAQFCVDLTAHASEGLIDPVIGRETEIERIVQILCRRTKNNPILLGESGVGKTAIAEGLATRIAQTDVPLFLIVCFFATNCCLYFYVIYILINHMCLLVVTLMNLYCRIVN